MLLLILPFLVAVFSISVAHEISIYADVYSDTEFFSRTFPWIIDNIGGYISVNFYMVGSGRYGIPQMCVLNKLKTNTYLQAQYLKCEAEGYPSQYCLCETGIDREEFKQCVVNEGNLSSAAEAKFNEIRVDVTPLLELGHKSTVFGVDDKLFLKKICSIFGDNLPRGCVKPFRCQQNETGPYHSYKKAIAHFDECCHEKWNRYYDHHETTEYWDWKA